MLTKWIAWLGNVVQIRQWPSRTLTRLRSLKNSQRKAIGLSTIVLFVVLFYFTDDDGRFSDVLRYSFLLFLTIGFLIYFYAWNAEKAQTHARSSSVVPPTTRNSLQRYWPLLLLVLIGLGFTFYMLWTDWVQPQTPSEKNDFIRTFFTILGGTFIAFQLWLAYLNKEATAATLKLSEDRHIAELFQGASDQLGDEDSGARRIAGLYTLERMSKEYDTYYHQCIEVICFFARNRSDDRVLSLSTEFRNRADYLTSDELSVAAQILGRRKYRYLDGENQPLDLSGVDFSGVKFKGVDFEGANFSGSTFNNAEVQNSNFSFTNFAGSSLRNSAWHGTYLVCTPFMSKYDSSVQMTVSGISFTKNPLRVVRSLKPETLSSLLPIGRNRLQQPVLVPTAFLVAGGSAADSPEYEKAYRDMAMWRWFLECEAEKDDRNWWWDSGQPNSSESMQTEWIRYRAKYDNYAWDKQQGPLDE